MFRLITILLLTISTSSFCQKGVESIFNNGEWFKLAFTEKGVYKLDKAYLDQIGLSVQNPRGVRVYGNSSGGMLPQQNSLPFLDQEEISLGFHGNEDDIFSNDEYFLLFVNSPNSFAYDTSKELFTHEKNLYSDSIFYFIKYSEQAGKRIATKTKAIDGQPAISTYDDYFLIEEDKDNIRFEGRRWFGEMLSNATKLSLNYTSGISGITNGSSVSIYAEAVSIADIPASFDFTINDQHTIKLNTVARPQGEYDADGIVVDSVFVINSNDISGIDSKLDINVTYNAPASGVGQGYIDFLMIQFTRDLAAYEGNTFFRSLSTLVLPESTFQIKNMSDNMEIWNITDPTTPENISYQLDGTTGRFAATNTELDEYVVFNPANAPKPVKSTKIFKQNILTSNPPDAVIVTHYLFLSEAERLATFHRSHDLLDVKVVTVEEVYNEFSSGRQDISAIRNYMKYLYDLDPGKLKYLLLFGDCSYDYKKRFSRDQNFVPIYEARESLDPIYSYSSDDYFGFLEEDEGEWAESYQGDHTMEIGVGRLPVKSIKEAEITIDKIIRYETSSNSMGEWRNDIYFIADDGDSNVHQRDAEQLSELVETVDPQFNSQKVYLDAFEQISGVDRASPQTTQRINDIVAKGGLILNYSGHGNIDVWADEWILVKQDVRNFTNRRKLPLFVTATCEFGKYDYPLEDSAGEELLMNPNGGAIALLTTTRKVFAHTNRVVNEAFYENVFVPVNGETPRLGDIIKKTKNSSLRGPINRNFALLGDPMMKLAIPDYNLNITEVNNLSAEGDTLSALSLVQIKGTVVDQVGNKLSDFNGTLTAKVLDKPTTLQTRGNQNNPFNYSVRNTIIYNGQASISNGDFLFEFVVPKNIAYNYANGKISMYATSDDKKYDANGANIDIVVGGSNPNVTEDTTPPEIDIYMNDTSFKPGDKVNPNPLLLVRLTDENGINISNRGIGQNSIAILDDELEINLNEYYTASIDTYKEGWINYPMNDLAPGRHTIKIKSWDTHNNSAESSVEFVVSSDVKIKFYEVYNFPNPMTNNTTFHIAHDRDGEELLIDFEVFNTTGAVVYSQQYRYTDPGEIISDIEWDGKNLSGAPLRNGVYIYKFHFRSTLDGATNEVFRRLVITN